MAGSLAKFAEAAIRTRLSKPASYPPHRVSNHATTSSTTRACSTKARRQSHSLVHPRKSHGDRKPRSSCATSGEIRLMSASRTTDDPAEPSDGLFVGATRSASYNASLMSRDEIGYLAQLCYCEAVRAGSIWIAVGLITERGSLAETVNVPQVSSKTQVRARVSVLPRVALSRVSRSMMTDADLRRLPFSDVPHDHTWSVERKPQIGGNIRHPAVKHPCRTILEQTHCALERGRTRGHAAVRKGRREFLVCILRRGLRNGVADHNRP